MNGVILIDKPAGITSFDVVYSLRKLTKVKKIGHAGTLDPFATGLLIVCISRNSTRHIDRFTQLEKTYTAKLRLGKKTDTADIEGKILKVARIPELSRNKISDILKDFEGQIEQVPPTFSAIKKDGKPLYKFARKGIEVKVESRTVTIHSIKLKDYIPPDIIFCTKVSKGTYIRTLGEDIAQKLGTVGHLIELRRDSIGPFIASEAIPIDELTEDTIKHHIHPIDEMTERLSNERPA